MSTQKAAGHHELVAALPMYDLPGLANAHDVWYQAIRRAFAKVSSQASVPDTKELPAELCRQPETLLEAASLNGHVLAPLYQTCGLPLVSGHRDIFRLVAVPHYDVDECRDGHYCSVIVARDDVRGNSPSDFHGCVAAVNGQDSLSGCIMLYAWLGAAAQHVRVVTTGAHASSLEHLRQRTHGACLAAIDAVTLALLCQEQGADEVLRGLRIVGHSPTALALPYVTSAVLADRDPSLVPRLQQALQQAAQDPDPAVVAARHRLHIARLEPAGPRFTFDTYRARILALERDIHAAWPPAPAADKGGSTSLDSSVPGPFVDAVTDQTGHPLPVHRGHLDTDAVFLARLIDTLRHFCQAVNDNTLAGPALNDYNHPDDGHSLWYPLMPEPHTAQPTDKATTACGSGGCTANAGFARVILKAPVPEVLARLDQATPDHPTAFVGFIGFRPRMPERFSEDCDTVAACWSLDQSLVSRLDPNKVIAYCSAEQRPGGDWGNLVLFRGPDLEAALEGFKHGNDTHNTATRSVAPRFYSHVRIHGCLLTTAGQQPQDIAFQRTLQVHYPLRTQPDRGLFRQLHRWVGPQASDNTNESPQR